MPVIDAKRRTTAASKGQRPSVKLINEGVLAKGMPAWGPVLGAKKVTEVSAYILSFHQEGEPIEVQTVWVPIMPK